MVWKFPIAHWMRKSYPTTKVDKLIPRMRYEIRDKPINVKGDEEWRRRLFGPQIRLKTIGKHVTKLIRDERIEIAYFPGYEVRNYAERLIMDAIRYGDRHRPTMERADFYLKEKNLVHKLFKVLVPRYINYSESFTRMHILPLELPPELIGTAPKPDTKDKHQIRGHIRLRQVIVLELKGNPLPPVLNRDIDSRQFLTNVLLRAAKREYEVEKQKTLKTE